MLGPFWEVKALIRGRYNVYACSSSSWHQLLNCGQSLGLNGGRKQL